jgi:hypothetical protein
MLFPYVHNNSCISSLSLNTCQLTPLLTIAKTHHFSTRLLVAGYVDSVDRVEDSFRIVTFQWIEGVSVKDELTIVALFKPTNRWPTPNSRMPNAKGMVFFTGIIQHMQHTTVTMVIETISFLNKKARPTAKSLARHSKLSPTLPQRRPSAMALRSAKRRTHDDSLEAFFKKEREYFLSD